jgi:hypothetical protein
MGQYNNIFHPQNASLLPLPRCLALETTLPHLIVGVDMKWSPTTTMLGGWAIQLGWDACASARHEGLGA